ncbi:MAG: KH domain-containing protein, partial [Thermofilaceae archaeon]
LLSDDNYTFESMDLSDIARNPNDLKRIKSRLIGENGKVKKTIENQTGAKILIGEKSVGILGEYNNVEVARKAINMLIEGRTHTTVYNFLRSASYELKKQKIKLWKEPWEAGR